MIHNIPQPDFEAFVAAHLQNDPHVEITKGVGFVSCEQVRPSPEPILHAGVAELTYSLQLEDQVITTVEERNSKTTYRIRSRHVIGCDGAKSQVRRSLGIESEGEDSCKSHLSLHQVKLYYLNC